MATRSTQFMRTKKQSPSPQLSPEQWCPQVIENLADVAIFMVSLEGRVESWNSAARCILGYAPEEITGQDFSRFYTPEERAAGLPAEALRRAAADGRFVTEGWRVRKDGSRLRARIVIDPVWDASGVAAGFCEVTREIDGSSTADQGSTAFDAVPAREAQQFRWMVQGFTDHAIYLLSPSGVVDTWNSGAERITGYRAAEVIGTHFSRFHTEQDRDLDAPRKALQVAVRDGRFEKEVWRIRRDGSDFLAHVAIHALHDESGQLTGFSEVTHDVTGKNQPALERMEGEAARIACPLSNASNAPDRPGTALIVEDEPDVLAVSSKLFRSLGYDVLIAATGPEAVDILRQSQQIDVLFTDVVMPRGMSGVSLARFAADIRPNTRVILASGYPMSVIVKDHGDIANFSFISKPYRWSELVERLKALATS